MANAHLAATTKRRRRGRVVAAAALLAVAGAMLGGCSRETRYEVLTFFFTGVPPYEEWAGLKAPEEEKAMPAGDRIAAARERHAEVLRERQLRRIARLNWGHGPYDAGQCQLCHALAGSLTFTGRGGARADAPATTGGMASGRLLVPRHELCVGCHSEKRQGAPETVGLLMLRPVASGQCTACHGPHQSKRRYMLLGENNVDMCARCHKNREVLMRTPAHARDPEADCLACHNAHVGKTATLLKSQYDEAEDQW